MQWNLRLNLCNMKKIAAIDIGTNTILMVIAGIEADGSIKILDDEHQIARLGEHTVRTGKISESAIGRAERILGHYSQICKEFGVQKISAVATSALRDAENKYEVAEILGKTIGKKIRIIDGKEEARLSFIGTAEDNEQSMVIDIGGGSTEYIIGNGNNIDFRISLDIGAVKLTEQFIENHPPDEESLDKLKKHIRQILNDKLREEINFNKMYAVAGTPTTIAAIAMGLLGYSDEKVHGYILELSELKNILNLFTQNHLDYLINNLFIHPKRADVITAGTMILIESLLHLGKDNCIVSSKGLRYGVLKEMINNSL